MKPLQSPQGTKPNWPSELRDKIHADGKKPAAMVSYQGERISDIRLVAVPEDHDTTKDPYMVEGVVLGSNQKLIPLDEPEKLPKRVSVYDLLSDAELRIISNGERLYADDELGWDRTLEACWLVVNSQKMMELICQVAVSGGPNLAPAAQALVDSLKGASALSLEGFDPSMNPHCPPGGSVRVSFVIDVDGASYDPQQISCNALRLLAGGEVLPVADLLTEDGQRSRFDMNEMAFEPSLNIRTTLIAGNSLGIRQLPQPQ